MRARSGPCPPRCSSSLSNRTSEPHASLSHVQFSAIFLLALAQPPSRPYVAPLRAMPWPCLACLALAAFCLYITPSCVCHCAAHALIARSSLAPPCRAIASSVVAKERCLPLPTPVSDDPVSDREARRRCSSPSLLLRALGATRALRRRGSPSPCTENAHYHDCPALTSLCGPWP
jgi:hypothetical protein